MPLSSALPRRAHALDQRVGRGLQVDDQVGRGRLRRELGVDLLVEPELVVGQRQAREQRVLLEQEVGDHAPWNRSGCCSSRNCWTRWNRKNSCVGSA